MNILDKLAKQHGNNWQQKALDHLLILHIRQFNGIYWTDEKEQDYQDLLQWTQETIEAGITLNTYLSPPSNRENR